MTWTETNGREREQFMASEEDFAEFIRLTFPSFRIAVQPAQCSGATQIMFQSYGICLPVTTRNMSASLAWYDRMVP